MTPTQKAELRRVSHAWDRYLSACRSADGPTTGIRVDAMKHAEIELKVILWQNRERIVQLLREVGIVDAA